MASEESSPARHEPRDAGRPSGGADAGQPRRERTALVLGVLAALAVSLTGLLTLRWPALVISAAVGYGVYRLAGGGRA